MELVHAERILLAGAPITNMLIWFSFNPNMANQLLTLKRFGRNYLSIANVLGCNRLKFRNNKVSFHTWLGMLFIFHTETKVYQC